MLRTRYYAWDTQTLILPSPVTPSTKKLSPSTNLKVEVTLGPVAPSDSASETMGTAVGVTKICVTHYRHDENLLHSLIKISGLEITLYNISNIQVLSLVQFLRVSRFELARETSFVSTTTATRSSEENEAAPLASPHVLNGAASVILPDRRHWLQALYDRQNAGDIE